MEVQEGKLQRSFTGAEGLGAIKNAIQTFVATNKRLPCPASGTAMSGLEDRTAGSSACNSPTGIVPWMTLNIARENVLDAQGRFISLRVFSGTTGLTQDAGASMVDCDTIEPVGATLPSNGLCQSTHDHTRSQFLANKGLTVDNNGAIQTGVAYVLVDHGESGYGAWSIEGSRMTSATVSSPEWFNSEGNPQAGQTTFYSREALTTVSPSDSTHFDDRIVYTNVIDLIETAGLEDRDWPEPVDPTTINLTAAATSNMTTFETGQGHFTTTSGSGRFTAPTPTTLRVGNASGTYSRCIWWPDRLEVYNTSSGLQRDFRVAMALAFPSSGDVGNGFVFGILSGATALTELPCGTSSNLTGNTTANDIGWGGGNYPSSDRFGVEVDLTRHSTTGYNDPAGTLSNRVWHMGILYADTKHDGVTGPLCASQSTTWGSACYHPNISSGNILRGTSLNHLLRVEVSPRACNAGASPLVRAWFMRYSVCSTNSAKCGLLSNLTNAASTISTDWPSGTAFIEQCLPAPASISAYDLIYFGITTSNNSTNTAANFYINSMQSGTFE